MNLNVNYKFKNNFTSEQYMCIGASMIFHCESGILFRKCSLPIQGKVQKKKEAWNADGKFGWFCFCFALMLNSVIGEANQAIETSGNR